MPIDIPHLDFPPTIVNGQFLMVDQNSDDEVLGSAEAALRCPIGHRPLLPKYGTPNLEHTRAIVDRGAIVADAVIECEPRIVEVLTTEEIVQRATTIGVKVRRG